MANLHNGSQQFFVVIINNPSKKKLIVIYLNVEFNEKMVFNRKNPLTMSKFEGIMKSVIEARTTPPTYSR